MHSTLYHQLIGRPDTCDRIREVIHAQPLLVYWITPDGNLLDARNAHHDNPPHGDRSILSHRTHKGHLRGWAAYIGERLYIVICGDDSGKSWSKRQRKQIPQAVPLIRENLLQRGVNPDDVAQAMVIDEWGRME